MGVEGDEEEGEGQEVDDEDDDEDDAAYDNMEIEEEGSEIDDMDEAAAMRAMLEESSNDEDEDEDDLDDDDASGKKRRKNAGLFASAEEFADLLNQDNAVSACNGVQRMRWGQGQGLLGHNGRIAPAASWASCQPQCSASPLNDVRPC